MTQTDMNTRHFTKLLTRYETAFFELNEYETQVLPELKNGKVVNRKTIVTLEDFEATVQFMEEIVRQETNELSAENITYQEKGRSFFNWLAIAHVVKLIRSMVNPVK